MKKMAAWTVVLWSSLPSANSLGRRLGEPVCAAIIDANVGDACNLCYLRDIISSILVSTLLITFRYQATPIRSYWTMLASSIKGWNCFLCKERVELGYRDYLLSSLQGIILC
ncbi:hypothetical protein Droror1_Dr00001339 [Drosera rotundifolia]